MHPTNNPHGAGPSSRPAQPPPARSGAALQPPPDREVIEITDSEQESDVEIIGIIRPNRTKAEPSSVTRLQTALQRSRPSQTTRKKNPSVKQEVIDLSLDEPTGSSLIPLIDRLCEIDVISDDDSAPEGFELWEPTLPVRAPRAAPEPKNENNNKTEPVLAWKAPKMSWFREECTGVSCARAFVEYPTYPAGRPQFISRPGHNKFFEKTHGPGRPRWVLDKSTPGLKGRISDIQSAVLDRGSIVPIPNMNATRGSVNHIAQAPGYIAVGRTYEADAAYDGGGLALWKVKTGKAQNIPAHITGTGGRRPDNELEPQNKQHSILALSFDPATNTRLLSAGDDNKVQLWEIDEDNNQVNLLDALPGVTGPGCLIYRPEGRYAAIGHTRGFQIVDAKNYLDKRYKWQWKRRGVQDVVSMVWGIGRSQQNLAAGTQESEGVHGRLLLFDAAVGKTVDGGASESCSTLSLDPSGTITAFTGSGRNGKPHRHVLRLYDAQRMGWHPQNTIGIPTSKNRTSGEVIEAAWSPNGIHLALARDDNSVQVFDTRWLGQRGCLALFEHETEACPSEGENTELYGIQGLAWFGSEKLVSGGGDHCVRIWDVREDDSSRVLGTLRGAVGHLIGSQDPDLFPIVTGDLLGNAYFLPNRQLVTIS